MAVPDPGTVDELFGREADIAVGLEAVSSARLVTLIGLGGVGKTQLARALAARLSGHGHAVVLIDLGGTIEATLLPAEIAAAIALPGTSPDPLSGIARWAAELDRPVIVLDGVEQVPGAASVVEHVLGHVSSLRILATSRTPLDAAGEVTVRVEPLGLPDGASPDAVLASPAGALFVARARDIGRLSTLDEEAAADVARLTRRLDGLPLALELAAGRTRLLSPGAILRRLDSAQGSQLLERPEDAGGHRSLERVLDWSLDLLSDDARRVLMDLAIFAGTFDLEKAAELCPDTAVLDDLETLVEAALVRHEVDAGGDPRFRILETVREACRSRRPAAESIALRRRHLAVVAGIVARERDPLLGADRQASIERLHGLLGDLRPAFDFAIEKDPPQAVALVADVWRFWLHGGHGPEAAHRLRRAIAASPDESIARARGLSAIAGLRTSMEGAHAGRIDAEVAIRIARRLGDRSVELDALPAVALAAIDAGDLAGARRASRRSLVLAKDLDDRRALVRALATSGLAEGRLGDRTIGLRRLGEAVTEARAAGDALNEGIQLMNLAELEVELDLPRHAADHATAAVDILRDVDGGTYLVGALSCLGQVLAELGRLAEARTALVEAVRLSMTLDAELATAEALVRSMPYLRRVGALELTAQAWAAARRIAAGGRIGIGRGDLRLAERELEVASAVLDHSQFDRAVQAGSLQPAADVLSDVLSVLARPDLTTSVRREPATFVLTRREGQILRLLGQGLSDRQIAETLGISPKTASVHVSNVKAKLGVETRLEAAFSGRVLDQATDRPDVRGPRSKVN